MDTLLVPCDGSDNSLRAVRHAVDTVQQRLAPTSIELLHVLDPMTFTSLPLTLKDDSWRRERPAEVDRVLASAESIVREANVPYRVCWRVGEPVDEIAAEAKDKRFAAIVLGTRGRGAIANLLLGSVSSRVAFLVDVPVTLVK
jgi:nucleotide-binding universal stress UspA family protein